MNSELGLCIRGRSGDERPGVFSELVDFVLG